MSLPPERLFGTDGIRGVFGEPPLDVATVTRLGWVLARHLGRDRSAPRVVLGGDTRDSTPVLCRWLAAGLRAGGAEVVYVGIVPTPAVAMLARRLGMAAGVAVSASHNPWPDNGIKLIDARGFKWRPEEEAELETELRGGSAPAVDEAELTIAPGAVDAYLEELISTFPAGRPLVGLRIAIDAANGAASPYARGLFEGLGAEVVLAHAAPDGSNVNRGCGSTHPAAMATLTVENGCDLGCAFDGDADRVILADEKGTVRDGDAILYLWARELQRQNRLPGARVVATTMSNLGLEVALARHAIELVRCDVGDREVVATMFREGIDLGGEQSGHVVYLPLSTTGDGLLTALQMAALLARGGQPLSGLLEGFEKFPQLIRNVRVTRKPDLLGFAGVRAQTEAIERELGREGRLVLRYSGTEPLARIMIEGRDQAHIETLAADLAHQIATEVG